MLKPYKMHGEQIASIAQTMKELYHVRRVDSNMSSRSGSGGVARTMHEDRDDAGANPRFNGITMPKKKRSSKNSLQSGSTPDSAMEQGALLSTRCFRCGDYFPETDFLYTKKSSLCISCWERKITVE